MTEKVYELFRQTKPRIRQYERDRKGKVLVGAMCSVKHKESLEKFFELCNKSEDYSAEKITENNQFIYFTVTADLEFTDQLIKDFIS